MIGCLAYSFVTLKAICFTNMYYHTCCENSVCHSNNEKYVLCHCMTFKDTVFIFVKSLEILKTEIILTYCTCRPTSYSTIKLSIMFIYYFLLYLEMTSKLISLSLKIMICIHCNYA